MCLSCLCIHTVLQNGASLNGSDPISKWLHTCEELGSLNYTLTTEPCVYLGSSVWQNAFSDHPSHWRGLPFISIRKHSFSAWISSIPELTFAGNETDTLAQVFDRLDHVNEVKALFVFDCKWLLAKLAIDLYYHQLDSKQNLSKVFERYRETPQQNHINTIV